MLTDDLALVVERLRLAEELDEPMTPENCGLLASVIGAVQQELREYAVRQLRERVIDDSPNVVRLPREFRCVTPEVP